MSAPLRPAFLAILGLLVLPSCKPEPAAGTGSGTEDPGVHPLEGTVVDEVFTLEGPSCPVEILRTAEDVPHIYAESRADLAFGYGFAMARHRFFELELARRLALGETSALLGQDGLQTDMESRGSGMRHVAEHLEANLTAGERELVEAFAGGINAYIALAQAGELPVASELELAGPLLGEPEPATLMTPYTALDITAIWAVVIYELGYETGDVGRQAAADILPGLYGEEDALYELRAEGLIADIWEPVAPVRPISAAEGFGSGTAAGALSAATSGARLPPRSRVPPEVFARLAERHERIERRQHHDHELGWGSNAWAISGAHTADGRSYLAADGHLPLSVPSMFYRVGLDTSVLGEGDTHQAGLGIVGVPYLATGTNGRVAWGFTQLMGDITDWYAEELQLDDSGLPAATRFEGEWQPLEAHSETYEVADVPILGSEGRTETWTRWTTFDGRWIADIEGRSASEDETLDEGEALVNLQGDLVVPGDLDGDGVITAVSFDYTALDPVKTMAAIDRFGHADDVEEFREATRGSVALSLNLAAVDSGGTTFYTGYQGVPCRTNLAREEDGRWAEGADPSLLLDGTTYGGFTIPIGEDLMVVQGGEGDECTVPFEEYPHVLDHPQGFVVTANNDPGGMSLDGSLTDDAWYIGGPWMQGYRAWTIAERLEAAMAAGTADEDEMADIQADISSPLGLDVAPVLLDAIERARTLSESDGPLTEAEARLVAHYEARAAQQDEVAERLAAWLDAGARTPSGVETFYEQPTAQDLDDAVAATIFNAWNGPFIEGIFSDEGIPGVWRPTGKGARMRVAMKLLDGRGPGNPEGLASWNPETEESAFFDVLGTPEVETSDELALAQLNEALAFLEGAYEGDGNGGFETDDMSAWIWGLRHQAKFESVLEDFVGDEFSFISDSFSITTEMLPLAEGMSADDPRADLTWFPRGGDNFSVDAANAGFSGRGFQFGSGPVYRMVVGLDGEGAGGRNILPNGQSAQTDSPHFADQAELWLANETTPLLLDLDAVLAASVLREQLQPVSPGDCRWTAEP